MMKKLIVNLVLVVAVILTATNLLACKPELESITIGERPYEANALFYIAQDKGYFAGNGLDVTMKPYESVTKVSMGC